MKKLMLFGLLSCLLISLSCREQGKSEENGSDAAVEESETIIDESLEKEIDQESENLDNILNELDSINSN